MVSVMPVQQLRMWKNPQVETSNLVALASVHHGPMQRFAASLSELNLLHPFICTGSSRVRIFEWMNFFFFALPRS
jgi:fido (protein-threonine AMPylation protein)